MARPKLALNETDVYDLAAIGCTYEEIASLVGCDKSTLEKRFSGTIKTGHDNMKMSVRRKSFQIAMDDTHKQQASMLIFLRKVVLGDKEYNVIDARTIGLPSEIELSDAQPPSRYED